MVTKPGLVEELTRAWPWERGPDRAWVPSAPPSSGEVAGAEAIAARDPRECVPIALDGATANRHGVLAAILTLAETLEAEGRRLEIRPLDPRARRAIETFQPTPAPPTNRNDRTDLVDLIGERGLVLQVSLLSWALVALAALMGVPGILGRDREGRRALLLRALVTNGVHAGPLVALIALLIGAILALQAGAILEDFGQTDFIADLVATSMAKEIGPLLTAILVAGRSGAALCAEIGTMRVSEELDALEVMGVKPIEWVVSPRLLALVLGLPLLVAVADVVGTFGGWVIASALHRVPTATYLDRVELQVSAAEFLVGLLKGFLFGFVIATIAAWQGLRVRGGAAGVGAATTRAVVGSIVWIIVVNAGVTLIDTRLLR